METQDQVQVFISYASQDQIRVLEVYDHLIRHVHPNVWIDCRRLLPGQPWEAEILKNLRQSDIILVFISNTSVQKRGVVQKELNIVLKYLDEKLQDDIYIIPIKLDSDAQVPDKLRHLQWVDMNSESALSAIQNAVKSQIEKFSNSAFKSVAENDEIMLSRKKFNERWEGLPGYQVSYAIPIFSSSKFENLKEISNLIEGKFIRELHEYRRYKLCQDPKFYDWSQHSGRRTSWFDAQISDICVENNFLSLVYKIYWYGAGAAHPNGYFISFNFLLNPLIEISNIKSLFESPDSSISRVGELVSKAFLDLKLDDEEVLPSSIATESNSPYTWETFPAFACFHDGLRLYYDSINRFSSRQYITIPYSYIEDSFGKTIQYALSLKY